MREKEIEKMLVNAVKIHGGLALKFVSPNFTEQIGGVLDEIEQS